MSAADGGQRWASDPDPYGPPLWVVLCVVGGVCLWLLARAMGWVAP